MWYDVAMMSLKKINVLMVYAHIVRSHVTTMATSFEFVSTLLLTIGTKQNKHTYQESDQNWRSQVQRNVQYAR